MHHLGTCLVAQCALAAPSNRVVPGREASKHRQRQRNRLCGAEVLVHEKQKHTQDDRGHYALGGKSFHENGKDRGF